MSDTPQADVPCSQCGKPMLDAGPSIGYYCRDGFACKSPSSTPQEALIAKLQALTDRLETGLYGPPTDADIEVLREAADRLRASLPTSEK